MLIQHVRWFRVYSLSQDNRHGSLEPWKSQNYLGMQFKNSGQEQMRGKIIVSVRLFSKTSLLNTESLV